jgi:hypothetical protein
VLARSWAAGLGQGVCAGDSGRETRTRTAATEAPTGCGRPRLGRSYPQGNADLLSLPPDPSRNGGTGWHFSLSWRPRTGGRPAESPTLSSGVPNWSARDTIALGAGRVLRVVDVRDVEVDASPVLVVEGVADAGSGAAA